MQEMTLKQLEVFAAVVESGSFSRAAEQLYLSQSTVSSHLSGLERILGVRLLERDRHRLQLTPEGEAAYAKTRQILAAAEALTDLFPREREAELLLGASSVPGKYLLPAYLAAFLRQHPRLRYRLRQGDSAQIHELIVSGQIRLGLVGACLLPEQVEHLLLAEDKLVLVTAASPRFRQLQEQGVWGRELLGAQGEPLIAREQGSGTDRSLHSYWQHSSGEPLPIVARVEDTETIKRMVAQGAGVSVLSALAVAEEVEQGRLLAFEMDRTQLTRGIFLAWQRGLTLSPVEREFSKFLRQKAPAGLTAGA